MMRILLTNDDGYHAPGMAVLEAIARQLSDDIWVCAPAEEQSGAGHSLTLSRPVRIREHGERRWSCSGTPTDSVMMAIGQLMPEKPDLILSGVNRGANLGADLTYSIGRPSCRERVCHYVLLTVAAFFFNQKTAYEMRISDWSSDVCSSDLISGSAPPPRSNRAPAIRSPSRAPCASASMASVAGRAAAPRPIR